MGSEKSELDFATRRVSVDINSADHQTPAMGYLGLLGLIQNLRHELGVVVEIDNCLLFSLRNVQGVQRGFE